MRFFKKCCFGFCGLKLRIGRGINFRVHAPADAVLHHAPAVAVKHPDPSVSIQNPIPSVPVQNPELSVPVQNPDPSAPVQIPDPSVSIQNPNPSAPVGIPNPSVPVQNPDPSVPVQNPDPSVPVQHHDPAASAFHLPSLASVCRPVVPAGSLPSVGFYPSSSSGSDSFELPVVGLRRRGSVSSVGNVVPSPISSSGSASPVSSSGSVGTVSSIPSAGSVYASISGPSAPNVASPVAPNSPPPVAPNSPPPVAPNPPAPFIGPLPTLGRFPRYGWQDVDLGSSVNLAYYQIQANMRPDGPEHMPDGIIGCVFNFPQEILRTRARVVHVCRYLTVRSSMGHIIHIGDLQEDVGLGRGGIVTVGAGGTVYARNLEPIDVEDECVIAVPIGGSIMFYDFAEDMDTNFEVYWEET